MHPVKPTLLSIEISPVILPSNDIDKNGKHRGTFGKALITDPIGYIQNISKGEYPGQTKIKYLPIIDLSPTKEKCIYLFNSFIYSRTSEHIKFCYSVHNI